MKILKLAAAAAIVISGFSLPAAAQPPGHDGDRYEHRDRDRGDQYERHDRGDRYDNGRHRGWERGRHHGWRNHRRHRVCRWTWRHHHRVRRCWWTRW